jgi:large subunit ribosomal protein L5
MAEDTTSDSTQADEGTPYVPRLKALYNDQIRAELKEQLEIANVMQVPRLTKIVVNAGVGEAVGDSKVIEKAMKDLATITGQKPQVRKARKSIAVFKLREGMSVGARVTLRNDRMWDFLDRLLTLALPRIRDFRGLPDKFDGHGNYTLGVTEQLIFPEIDYDDIDAVRGMDITFVTTATDDVGGRALLDAFGFPFVRAEGETAPPAMQRLQQV